MTVSKSQRIPKHKKLDVAEQQDQTCLTVKHQSGSTIAKMTRKTAEMHKKIASTNEMIMNLVKGIAQKDDFETLQARLKISASKSEQK